jgi:hypothetical protein
VALEGSCVIGGAPPTSSLEKVSYIVDSLTGEKEHHDRRLSSS